MSSIPLLPSARHAARGCVGLPLFLILVILALACPYVASQSQQRIVTPSPGFFADQPLHTLVTNTTSTATFTLTFAYSTTTPLLLTNATSVTLSVPAIFSNTELPEALSAVNSAGLRAFLLTSSALTSTCQRADSTQQRQCTITVTLTTPQPHQFVTYSLYTLNDLSYSNPYSATVAANTWKYYVQYIQYNDLDVTFQLNPLNAQLTSLMFISAAQSLFTPGFPRFGANGSVAVTVSGQSCLLPRSEPDVPDWYVVGVYGFASPASASQLTLTNNDNTSSSTNPFGGYAILSLLSLVLAAGFIGLVVLRGCCMYRQWNMPGRHSSGFVPEGGGTPVVLDPAAFQTTAGQSGVLRLDRAAACATEAEIAALPTVIYVRSMSGGGEGDEECEDARCTICLDEFESGVSHITTLRCAHTFHTGCVGAWLRQRRHCPLCLQLIDQAQDVKQRRNSVAADVEMVNVRPPTVAVVVPASRPSDPASRTLTDDRDSVVGLDRYSSAAQEEDADMCAIEIATPQHIGRAPL